MNPHDLARELEKRFGVGDFPHVRRRLYQRLQRIVQDHGERALFIVACCRDEAANARKPGNWFSSAVTRRLKEAQCWEPVSAANESRPAALPAQALASVAQPIPNDGTPSRRSLATDRELQEEWDRQMAERRRKAGSFDGV